MTDRRFSLAALDRYRADLAYDWRTGFYTVTAAVLRRDTTGEASWATEHYEGLTLAEAADVVAATAAAVAAG